MTHPIVQRFERNVAGRDFVVGDVHGEFDLLSEQMDRVRFDPALDRMFSVGDLVDRGPKSRDALNWMAQPWFHAIRGNHEDMAIWYACGRWPEDNYRRNGGGWLIDLPAKTRQAIAQAFLTMPIVIEVDTKEGAIGIVHAEPTGHNWGEFLKALESEDPCAQETALWARRRIGARDCSTVSGVAMIYVGHTPRERPETLGNVRYIDTGAVYGGKLTMVQIAGQGEEVSGLVMSAMLGEAPE